MLLFDDENRFRLSGEGLAGLGGRQMAVGEAWVTVVAAGLDSAVLHLEHEHERGAIDFFRLRVGIGFDELDHDSIRALGEMHDLVLATPDDIGIVEVSIARDFGTRKKLARGRLIDPGHSVLAGHLAEHSTRISSDFVTENVDDRLDVFRIFRFGHIDVFGR